MDLTDKMVKDYLHLQKCKKDSIKKFEVYLQLKENACMRCDIEWEVNYSELAINEKHKINLIDDKIIELLEPILLNQLQL